MEKKEQNKIKPNFKNKEDSIEITPSDEKLDNDIDRLFMNQKLRKFRNLISKLFNKN
jgi:hypothetical protein